MLSATEKDLILSHIAHHNGKVFGLEELLRELKLNITIEELETFLNSLHDNNYIIIEPYGAGRTFWLTTTQKGNDFIAGGGFTAIEKTTKLQSKKEQLDYKLALWQLFVFWLTFFMALCSFVFTVYQYFR